MSERTETALANRPRTLDLTKVGTIYTKAGELKLFKTQVPLSIQDGTLVSPMGMSIVLCSADGYKAQARGSGMHVLQADSVSVAGVPEANPFVRRNPKTGRVLEVYSRSLSFAYTEMGVATVACKTVVFDLDVYQCVDLLAKQKKCPQDFRLVPIGMAPPDKMWATYPIDDSTAIQVNTASNEFATWMRSMLNRRRKAVEIAQTFSNRNATKSHPLITFHKLEKGSSVVVPMVCWRATSGEMRWDGSQFKMLEARLTAMADGREDPRAAGVEVAETGREAEAIHDEHEVVEAELGSGSSIDQDDLPWDEPDPDGREAGITQADRLSAELRDVREQNPDVFRRACKSAKLKPDCYLDHLSEAQLITLHGAAAALVKKEGGEA